ncbi:MAG: sporulation-like protein [Piscirickettsiaceae bacterium]|nr:MAG: sporulation-like protein [Piscirickettsiaceae bacterium]PCI70304.1 MAG: sporulation-like protein [Piscirickettsiaceae bacterium]
MTRDYKNRVPRNTRKKKSKPIPGWSWLVVGLLVGGFIMFLSNLQNTSKPAMVDTTSVIKKQDVRDVKKATAKKPLQDLNSNKPRYDFYTILPEMEIIIPQHEIDERRRLEGTGKSKPGTFIVQIGSFKKMSQADTLKARVALLGIETSIQTVNTNGVTWHRVKSGPHKSFRNVDKIQNMLHRNHIDSIAIKLN